MQAPKFIAKEKVLAIHARQLNKFGGTPGLRDAGLLDPALAQPQATFSGELLHPTIAEQSATYLYPLAMNHLFVDGNNRTAVAVMNCCTATNKSKPVMRIELMTSPLPKMVHHGRKRLPRKVYKV